MGHFDQMDQLIVVTRFLLAVLVEMAPKTYRIFEVGMEEDAVCGGRGANHRARPPLLGEGTHNGCVRGASPVQCLRE